MGSVLLSRLVHWGPICALSVVFICFSATIMCLLEWWPPGSSVVAAANFLSFCVWTSLTLSNFLSAVHFGPGRVPSGWKPMNPDDQQFLQFCQLCGAFKAPRSHHCRKCDSCVLKMDHHCPWINNCCGHRNQPHFVKFLFWAVVGCLHSTFILGPSIYRGIFRMRYLMMGTGMEPIVHLGLYQLLYAMFAVGLALGVSCSVGFLFIIQMRSVLRNRTGIEDWILTKARHRRECLDDDDPDANPFVFPYDLGWKENFCQFFSLFNRSYGDGIVWPVVEGCDQYSLTVEQKKQKEEKRHHLVQFVCVRPYSGSFIPVSLGCGAACCLPLTDEPRLNLNKGDLVATSRWKKHWLYGELVSPQEGRRRGWFPRICVKQKFSEDLPDTKDKTE